MERTESPGSVENVVGSNAGLDFFARGQSTGPHGAELHQTLSFAVNWKDLLTPDFQTFLKVLPNCSGNLSEGMLQHLRPVFDAVNFLL